MSRPGRTIQPIAEPCDLDERSRARRIKLFHRRRKHHVRTFRFGHRAVRVKRARIAREIFVRSKLRWIHKDAQSHAPA